MKSYVSVVAHNSVLCNSILTNTQLHESNEEDTSYDESECSDADFEPKADDEAYPGTDPSGQLSESKHDLKDKAASLCGSEGRAKNEAAANEGTGATAGTS